MIYELYPPARRILYSILRPDAYAQRRIWNLAKRLMKPLAKIVNHFRKGSILYVWQGSKNTSSSAQFEEI